MRIKNPNMIADAMYNSAPYSGANDDYCKGVATGCVSALMAMGMPFPDALQVVLMAAPSNHRPYRDMIPKVWVESANRIRPQTPTEIP